MLTIQQTQYANCFPTQSPDKNKGDPKAKERFTRLGVIVSILRDSTSRER